MIGRGVLFLGSASITWVFLINLCHLIYQCGCTWMWSGAAQHCNIHDAESRHCPWCSIGDFGFYSIAASIIVLQGVIALGPGPWRLSVRALGSLAAFPILGSVIGVVL